MSVSKAGGIGGKGIAYGGIPMNDIGGSTNGDPGTSGTAVVFGTFKLGTPVCVTPAAPTLIPTVEVDRFPSFAFAKLAASLPAG